MLLLHTALEDPLVVLFIADSYTSVTLPVPCFTQTLYLRRSLLVYLF